MIVDRSAINCDKKAFRSAFSSDGRVSIPAAFGGWDVGCAGSESILYKRTNTRRFSIRRWRDRPREAYRCSLLNMAEIIRTTGAGSAF
jgi:hypothetical protein